MNEHPERPVDKEEPGGPSSGGQPVVIAPIPGLARAETPASTPGEAPPVSRPDVAEPVASRARPGGGSVPRAAGAAPGGSSETPAAPTSAAPKEARPAARRSGSGGKWLFALLVLAALAGGGYYGWLNYGQPYLASLRAPKVTAPTPSPTIATPRDSSAAPVASAPTSPVAAPAATPEQLAARVADLEATLARLADAQQRLVVAEQQVAALADRLTNLEGAKAQAQDVDQLERRIVNLEGAAGTIGDIQRELRVVASTAEVTRGGFAKTVGAALAVRHLANAVAQGGTFAPELAEVRALTVEEPSLAEPVAALEPYAADGVPTLARLKAEFPTVATAAVRAEQVAHGDGFVTRLVNGAKSLVTVRLTGDAAARVGGTQGVVARAENALSGNDLAGAVAITEELGGPAADAAANWLAAARARLAVDRAVTALDRLATQKLASSRG